MRNIVLSILMSIVCMGCSVVVAPEPFGSQPVEMNVVYTKDVWVDENGEDLILNTVDQEKGIVDITYKESETSVQTVRAYLRAGEKWQYASILNSDEGDTSQGYLFACIKSTPSKKIVWFPDHQEFKALVEKGVIQGKIVNGDVVLANVTPELIRLIESQRYGLLFEWQEPLVFKKKKE